MEDYVELMYQAFGVILFCLAVSLLFMVFGKLEKGNVAVQKSIYEQHTLYTRED